jgi:tetratricopeptide (TPR) repeat protein
MIFVNGCGQGLRAFTVVCFLAGASRILTAQVSSWPLDGPAFGASPSEISAAAAKIVPEKFADTTVLYEEEKYLLDATGRVTSTHRLVYRIETPAAVQSWSQASVQWESFYQNEPSIKARVIQANGGVVELDQKTVTDVPAQDQGDGTYSDDRIHKAPLPALGVGAIVEEQITCVDKEPYLSTGGVYRNYFQRMVPITRSRLVVEVPADTPLNFRTGFLPDLAVKDETVDWVHRLTLDEGHISSWINPDINLATRVPHAPWVEFSTGKSWQAIAVAYSHLAEPQIQPGQVKDLLPAKRPGDQLAVIRMLVATLHREVRYTGVEFGKSKLQPQITTEILRRRYGDCKDKASLLVALLRAEGIHADLALLETGPERDVNPELPGVNQFNHAIVYVPASGGNSPLWIDATAEFTQVGDLPYQDQGRLALIISEDTRALTLTPDARPEDSVLTETREFFLADYGPAHVVESSRTTGYIDASYRSYYGGPENKDMKAYLENYVRRAYDAKALTAIDHGDGRDLTKPFVLRLDVAKATRGNTGISEASAAIFPVGTYSNLPAWFSTDPDQGNAKPTADEESNRRKAEEQRSSEYEVQPFTVHREYKIVPPAGFAVRALPANKVVQLGPATLSEGYAVDSQGVVTANFTFTTVKSHYPLDEVLALRKAVLEANKAEAVIVTFDQAGAKLLDTGKIREALAVDKALIASHPKDAIQHLQMAYLLMKAGIGDEARAEAKRAVELDPNFAYAWKILGWVLQNNSIGVLRGKGFDLNGAVDAYRKTTELDPEDYDGREDLASLFEFDARGSRYASLTGLNHAIEEYKVLKQQDKASAEHYESYLLSCLLYAHRYKDLLDELAITPTKSNRDSLSIDAIVATEGVAAGLRRADQVQGGEEKRDEALRDAGERLIWLRLYPEASQILSAGLQGQKDAPAIAHQIEIYRDLHPYDPKEAAGSDATAPVRQFMVNTMTGGLTDAEMSRLFAHHAYASDAQWQSNVKRNQNYADSRPAAADRSGMTPDVLADVTLGTMKLTAKGDDGIGYRVTKQTTGSTPWQFFVTKEVGVYKIVAAQGDTLEVGNEALYLLHRGDEAQARALLDWKRDLVHKGGGDDPLQGPLLARFWTSGETKGADAIELAAASLLLYRADISAMLPSIARKAAVASGPDQTDQAAVNLLLAEGYLYTGDSAGAKPAIDALLKSYPDSITALRLAGEADRLTHDWTGWNAMLDSRLTKHPDDRNLLLEKVAAAQSEGDFAAARKILRTVLDGGQATSYDYNSYAWNALFENKVDEDAIKAGQQSTTMTHNSQFSDQHTLACLYAAQGRTTEARLVLLQAMSANNMAEPNSATWFAFGTIYEQFGALDAAIAAFRKVEKPVGPLSPVDTYVLAQDHLKALHAMK